MDLPTVTSAKAADIVGVGYEGFRTYLKRGLLGRVGMLPGFHEPGADTHDNPTPMVGWQTFDAGRLCLMRVAKMLMDAGFSFSSANSVVSRQLFWSALQHDEEPVDRFLMVWPPYADHILFEPDDLKHLPQRLAEARGLGVVTLINLGDVQRYVADKLVASTS